MDYVINLHEFYQIFHALTSEFGRVLLPNMSIISLIKCKMLHFYVRKSAFNCI